MAKRSKHPDKEIEAAIVYAEDNGWTYKDSGKSAHACGRHPPSPTRGEGTVVFWFDSIALVLAR